MISALRANTSSREQCTALPSTSCACAARVSRLVPEGTGVDQNQVFKAKILHHPGGEPDISFIYRAYQDNFNAGHGFGVAFRVYCTARTVSFSTAGPISYTAFPTTMVSANRAISAARADELMPPP